MNISKKYIRQNFQFFLTIVIGLLLSGCVSFGGFRTSKKINQIKNQQQQGLWIQYIDSTHNGFLNKGKFNKGIPVGKWIYNTSQGKLDRIEVYRGKRIKIKHYHDNGKLALSGRAKIVNEKPRSAGEAEKLHFYYYGKWKYYSPEGNLEKTALYENGKLIEEEYKFNSGSLKYDSLVSELRALDLDFIKYRDTLNRIDKAYGRTSDQYKKMKAIDQKNDSIILVRVDKIMKRFGYPPKDKVGESNGVIFYIISSASWQIKEKYLDAFKTATVKGDISRKDMAYFEDKYLVAKDGSQLYGTQYKRLLDYTTVNYPVRDLANMNERRKAVGLEPVNLLEYTEKK